MIRTFCIVLPETPERTIAARNHFNDRMIQVEFFNGIHGETAGFKTVHPYNDDDHNDYIIRQDAVGCWLSHYMLWQALTLIADRLVLILEDDVKLSEVWYQRTIKALQDVPQDFDALFLGSCCCGDKTKTLVAGDVWDVRYPFCLHAYIVAKKALKVMLATNRRCYAKIDTSLFYNTWPKLKVYTVIPRIASQFNHDAIP